MSWLSENPWPLLLLLLGTAVIALISGASKGRSTCGICLLAAAGLYVFESAVVTPSEEVEVQLQIMLVAFQEHNQDVINSCIDDKSPKLRETAAEGLNMVTLTKDFHIKDLEMTVEANGQTAKAELRANGTLKVNQSDMITRVFSRWKTIWKRVGSQWKLAEVIRLNPVNGQEMGILETR